MTDRQDAGADDLGDEGGRIDRQGDDERDEFRNENGATLEIEATELRIAPAHRKIHHIPGIG